MSFEALLWATNDAPIRDVNEFAVLTMLAEKADPDGCNAFPSQPTIASRTHIDPKTVKRTLQRLTARGLIAKGDQSAASYLRADRRPIVYDLLIPYQWFPNIDRINKERQDRGRPPLSPTDRPDIGPAPEKTARSDKGTKRVKSDPDSRGDSESPRSESAAGTHGGTLSPERGDYKSGTGGLVVPRTSPLNQSSEPDAPAARSAVPDAGGKSSGSRDRACGGSAASGKSKPRRTKAQQQAIRAVREELARVLPDLASALHPATPWPLGDAILASLAVGEPHERTAEQLVGYRVLPRWTKHWAPLFYAGELPEQPIGPLVKMLGSDRSDHDRCDERVDVDTGQECRQCAVRAQDSRTRPAAAEARREDPAAAPGAAVPAPRPPAAPTCHTCHYVRPIVLTARGNAYCAVCAPPCTDCGQRAPEDETLDGVCAVCRTQPAHV